MISFFVVGIAATLLIAFDGFKYYTTPLNERFFSPQHQALKPSGLWGHGFGIIGSIMMIAGVSVYMIRKRVKRFFGWGYLKHWLELHIFLCTLGPVLVLYHTAFKFGGIVAVSFWSMAAVVLSGVIGRFIYVQIPRTIQGHVLSISELDDLDSELTLQLAGNIQHTDFLSELNKIIPSKPDLKTSSGSKGLVFLFKDFGIVRSKLSIIKREAVKTGISGKELKAILSSSKSKLVLARRIRLLRSMQKLFKYWHIVHLPFAVTMFAIMFVHVGVTIIFGYKWIF